MKLEGTNDQLMAMAAHRYCMGRMSYIVGSCMEWIRGTWEQLEPNTQNVMLRDTLEWLARNDDGKHREMCYPDEWADCARWMRDHMTPAQVAWIEGAVAHVDGAMQPLRPNKHSMER